MPNILFLQNNFSEFQGVMYLSRRLKTAGFKVHLLISKKKNSILNFIQEKKIAVVLFSLLYGYQFWAKEASRLIKDKFPHVKIIWGGIFSTFNIDYLEKVSPYVNAFFRGEADDKIVSLVEAVLGDSDLNDIAGAVYIKNGSVCQNSIPDYVDISSAMPDRDLYFNYSSVFGKNSTKIFVCSRGCIGSCSYCYNSKLKELYQDKPGSYVRLRNPESILDEIGYVKKKYGMKRIFFYDDILVFNKPWAWSFLSKYKAKVGLPYMCYVRADLVDEETVRLLKETGCYMASFGLESGNEEFRNLILNKKITNEQIENAAALFRKFRLPFNTTNMVGFPHETYQMALQTIALNIKIKAIGSCNILNPFPGTKLYDYCRKNNLFEEAYFNDKRSQIHYYPLIKTEDRNFLGNLERLFQLTLFFPHSIFPLVKRLGRCRPNFIFDFIFLLCQFFYIKFFTERYSLRFMFHYYLEKFNSLFERSVD